MTIANYLGLYLAVAIFDTLGMGASHGLTLNDRIFFTKISVEKNARVALASRVFVVSVVIVALFTAAPFARDRFLVRFVNLWLLDSVSRRMLPKTFQLPN